MVQTKIFMSLQMLLCLLFALDLSFKFNRRFSLPCRYLMEDTFVPSGGRLWGCSWDPYFIEAMIRYVIAVFQSRNTFSFEYRKGKSGNFSSQKERGRGWESLGFDQESGLLCSSNSRTREVKWKLFTNGSTVKRKFCFPPKALLLWPHKASS